MKYLYACLALLLFMPSKNTAQAVQHAELLGRPTDHGITIQMVFSEAAEVCVRFGTDSLLLNEQTPWAAFPALEPAEITLGNLDANTRYFYQVCHRVPGNGATTFRAVHHFHTQRPAGSTFTFVVQADPHVDSQSDTALYRRCLENELADKPDFLVDLGDIFMSDKMKNAQNQITHDTVRYRVHLMRRFYESVCHSMPLFIALGNHEGEAGWQWNGTPENVAVYGTVERKKYFINPAPDGFYSGDTIEHPIIGKRENYYAWNWGDALFIVLDPYFYTNPKPDSLNGWRWTLGKTQYDWLKTTLESSTAPYKFVFAHQLVGGDPLGRGGIEFADRYEWGGKNLDGSEGWAQNRPGWYKPIKDLLTENRVTIFFHGHDHFFARQEKDCLIYQLTPQPSLPNFVGPNQADDYGYFAGQILPNTGHLRVSVGPEGVTTQYVRAYLASQETPQRKNRDVSATYFIGANNCYDSLLTSTPVLWNTNYSDELLYPNPTARDVQIVFSLAQPERLIFSVFNENGRLVRRLLDGNRMESGSYALYWDSSDQYGNRLPAGIYYYHVNGDKGTESSGKVVLVNE